MLNTDPRGYRVAVVADRLANPDPDTPNDVDVPAVLESLDFGMIVPPPDDFDVPTIAGIVEYLVDDLLDYRRHEYVVLVLADGSRPQDGVWIDHFEAEWQRRDVEPLPVLDVAELTPGELRAALEQACRRRVD